MKRNLWKGRLESVKSDGNVRSFISSLEDDRRIVEIDIDVAEAHCLMLHKMGHIQAGELRLILKGFEKAREDWRKGRLFKSGKEESFNDIHPFIEKYVIDAYGIKAGGKTHTGKSRNDQVNADIRMSLREELLKIAGCMVSFNECLLKLAEENKGTVMSGYTHMQDAQVTTFSHYILSQIDAYCRDIDRLLEVYRRINLNPLGAGALTGTTFRLDRRYTAGLLGFDGLVENTIDSVSSRDFILEFASALGIIMVNLSRLAEDLITFSTPQFGIIELSDTVTDISSAMPQKKNPDTLELVRGRASSAIGLIMQLFSTVKGLPTGYNRDMQEMKPSIWKIIDITKASVCISRTVMESIKINRQRMLELAMKNYVTATELAELIVKKTDLSFRESNFLVGNIVREAIKRNLPLSRVTAEDIRRISGKTIGREVIIKGTDLKKTTDPAEVIYMKNNAGHPAPSETTRSIKSRKALLREKNSILSGYRKKVDISAGKLHSLVKKYASTQ